MPNKDARPISFQDSRLKYLYVSHEKGSMRAAAETFGVATSSISRQIAKLEQELGIELVRQGSHRIALTEAGRLLIDYYMTRASHHEALLDQLGELQRRQLTSAVIAIGEGLLGPKAIHALQGFLRGHRDMRAEIVSAPSYEILRMVAEDEAHIGVVFSPDPAAPLTRLFSISQPLRVIVHRDSPLARRSILALDDIAHLPMVLPGPRFRVRELLEAACRDKPFDIVPSLTANSLAVILDFVRAGMGPTLLAELPVIEELNNGTLRAIPLDCPTLNDTDIQIVTRRSRMLPAIGRELATELAKAIRMQ